MVGQRHGRQHAHVGRAPGGRREVVDERRQPGAEAVPTIASVTARPLRTVNCRDSSGAMLPALGRTVSVYEPGATFW
ncbi:hypothetical protein GCM10025868_09710 [Angustibacter aerolatus]|uniref:Uncharacterized protein n=1 Tax=Angustibacter aerolatus TaxID=1162965 RepID=A0ABQ6JC15_9ACTN|nr:hypothetical protein GCM10025868_09710 [Angustibacter aerolatus]